MQAYSDPTRESDPFALPDIEIFYLSAKDAENWIDEFGETGSLEKGWYWWSCFPGCLPDSEPMGPFATEAQALADAQEGN